MNSLKYAQKMIDLRLSYMQNHKRDTERDCNAMSNLPIIPLDELLNKELTLSYYLDYLSVHNLQRYVIFYLSAKGISIERQFKVHSQVRWMRCEYFNFVLFIYLFVEWKATVIRYTIELQSNKLKANREDVFKLLRNKASNISTEVNCCFHFFFLF